MPGAHRQDDSRFCGATTIVSGQGNVRCNGKLWAVDGDQNTHGGGALAAVYGAKNVKINGKLVICAVGDIAGGDNAFHPVPPTDPLGHSTNVRVYSGKAGGGS